MKHPVLFVGLLLTMLICLFGSCEKEGFEKIPGPAPEPEKTFEPVNSAEIPEDAKIVFIDSGIEENYELNDLRKKCLYNDCNDIENHLKSYYQPIVNASCKPMAFKFICCNKSGNAVTKALIVVPDPLHCNMSDKLETVEDQ